MSRKVAFEFDPFELVGTEPLKGEKKDAALKDIQAFVLEQVLSDVGESRSPVQGYGRFPALSKEYKKEKSSEGGTPIANLELTGAMLSALEVKRKGNTLSLQITGREGDKADGHNNHSGDSSLPLRRFIPGNGETFTRDILEGIVEIIETHRDE